MLVGISGLARYIGCKASAVRQQICLGRVPCVIVAGAYIIETDDVPPAVVAWLRAAAVAGRIQTYVKRTGAGTDPAEPERGDVEAEGAGEA